MRSSWEGPRSFSGFVEKCGIQLAAMASLMNCRASELLNIDDGYIAWCVDEAAATILGALRQGRKIRPPKTKDNRELLRKLKGEIKNGD